MIVLKSTLAKVEAERDALAAKCEDLRQSYLDLDVFYVREMRLRAEMIAYLRAEMRTLYIRDDKGRIRRHPSSGGEVTADAPPIPFEPSRPILDSALNKDRTGKHGSEVA